MIDLPLFGRKKRPSSNIKTYENLLDEAKNAISSGDEDKAQILFRRIHRWINEDAVAVANMNEEEKNRISEILTEAGENMLMIKDYDYAIKMLEKAKTLNDRNVRAWLDIGRNLMERNTRIPYAISCLQEAVKLDPKNIEAYLLLGDGFRLQGQNEKALKAYHNVLEIDPENTAVMERILKIEEDIDILKRYAEVLEKTGDTENLVGVYNRLATLTGEESYLEKGLQIDPENKELLITKASMLKQNNNYIEAMEIAKMLLDKYPDDPGVQVLYEEIAGEEGKEEVKPIGVEELFGDFEIEGIGEIEEEAPEIQETEKRQTERKEDEVSQFLTLFKDGKLDMAKKLLSEISKEDFEKLLSGEINYDLAKFIVENVELERSRNLIDDLIAQNRIGEVEKFLNEILKKDFKNSKALFLKARLMAAKDSEMGARNFLTMSIKFDPKMKDSAKEDSLLKKYASTDWFKKLIS